jgi:hypothetical protein
MKTWEERQYNDTEAFTTFRSAIGYSLGWFGAEYGDTYGWMHNFRSESKAVTRKVTDTGSQLKTYNVDSHETGVSVTGTSQFAATDQEAYYGVTPATGSGSGSNKYANLAYVLAERAVTELSVVADALLAANDIVDALVDEDGETPSSNYDHLDSFSYGNTPEQSDHYRYYLTFVEPGDIATWYSDSKMVCGVDGASPNVSVFLEIDGGNDPTEDGRISPYNLSTSDSDKQNLRRTDQDTLMYEQNGWTIERIPVEKIPSRGRRLGFSETRIEDRLDRNEPVYFAHDADIRRVE